VSEYAYGTQCPVCGRDIKRRPAELAGRPCPDCMEQHITPRDRYRLKNARLTDTTTADIITNARTLWQARQAQT
jgi:predicted RNA-binding Zn-ribbon protein involved in translation (DUF1610 family)